MVPIVVRGTTEVFVFGCIEGAKVDARNQDGCSAIVWASANGHTEVVLALVEGGEYRQ